MIEYYGYIKSAHQYSVFLSLFIFMLRSILMVLKIDSYRHVFYRRLAPTNDSLLLLLGVMLIIIHPANLLGMSWLQHKLLLLIAYIIAGTLAINRLKQYNQRIIFVVIAWLCALSMLYMAYYKRSILLLFT